MFQLIYELRKNCCGRVDGRTERDGTGIEGSIRGPRGPKKQGIGTPIIRVFCLPKLKTTFEIVLNEEEHIKKCIEIAEN